MAEKQTSSVVLDPNTKPSSHQINGTKEAFLAKLSGEKLSLDIVKNFRCGFFLFHGAWSLHVHKKECFHLAACDSASVSSVPEKGYSSFMRLR